MASSVGKVEVPDLEPKVAPPEAKKSSGPESSASAPGPHERPSRAMIKGSRRLMCAGCRGFLAEVKAKSFQGFFWCHRCKTNNSFVF